MIEYYPWSSKVLSKCIAEHRRGELSTLDLELTSKCTQASCIYCDSRPTVGRKHPNELNYDETTKLLVDAKKLGLKWVYSCGLGEPLEDSRFKRLVELGANMNVRFSMFTNGILIDEKKAKWLHENRVCLIIKMDTFDEATFDKILGKPLKARQIYKAIKLLLGAGYGKSYGNGLTDIAFSIVPTSLNFHDISGIIKFARDNNIFPSVGELEQAGRILSKKKFSKLYVDDISMLSLKKEVDQLLWKGYIRPICPTIITGLHIDNIGNCIVDSDTGLNCKWFLLKEPKVKLIGNVRKESLSTMFRKVKAYRKKCFKNNREKIDNAESTEYIFGGCGGSPKKIIHLARQLI